VVGALADPDAIVVAVQAADVAPLVKPVRIRSGLIPSRHQRSMASGSAPWSMLGTRAPGSRRQKLRYFEVSVRDRR
jgi:hypothetical protein